VTEAFPISLALSPHGKLYVERMSPDEASRKNELSLRLEEAFAAGSAEGLFALARDEATSDLPSPFLYWRDLGRLFLTRVCGLPEGAESGAAIPAIPPPGDDLQALTEAAPAMKGAEYLSADLLESLWREMESHFQGAAGKFKGGLRAYIAAEYPTWHTVGRVCFHLAENKKALRVFEWVIFMVLEFRQHAGEHLQSQILLVA